MATDLQWRDDFPLPLNRELEFSVSLALLDRSKPRGARARFAISTRPETGIQRQRRSCTEMDRGKRRLDYRSAVSQIETYGATPTVQVERSGPALFAILVKPSRKLRRLASQTL